MATSDSIPKIPSAVPQYFTLAQFAIVPACVALWMAFGYASTGPAVMIILLGLVAGAIIACFAMDGFFGILSTGAAWLVIAISWLGLITPGHIDGPGYARLIVVLAAWMFAASGLTLSIAGLRIRPPYAGAMGCIIMLAWLTWPVWLLAMASPPAALVNALVALHPFLVCNGVLIGFPAWTEMPMAYRLTTLGQDLPLQLPTAIGACVLVHGLIGIAGVLIFLSRPSRRRWARWWLGRGRRWLRGPALPAPQ